MAALVLAWVSPAMPAEKKPAKTDRIAVVNGVGISRGDFERMKNNVLQRRIRSRGKLLKSEIEKEALENLINGELLYQESIKKGIKVDDAAVDDQFKKWKKRYPTDKAYKTALAKMNIGETELKTQIKRELVIRKYVKTQIADKTTVTDEEIKAHCEKVKERIREYLKRAKVTKAVDQQVKDLKSKAKVQRLLPKEIKTEK
jgi:hypothetical protein